MKDAADASDHAGAAKAIAAGLLAGHTKENPENWLHTGGTGILTFEDSDSGVYGNKSEKTYDGWEGVEELLTLPDHAFHRNVDQLVLEAGAKHADVLKTALVCPPTIYGKPTTLKTRVIIDRSQSRSPTPRPSTQYKTINLTISSPVQTTNNLKDSERDISESKEDTDIEQKLNFLIGEMHQEMHSRYANIIRELLKDKKIKRKGKWRGIDLTYM